MSFLMLKALHIISAFLLFGTGLGSAFYKFMADKHGDIKHIAITNRHVVIADWIFTTPAVIFQPISGVILANMINLPLTTPWIMTSLILYVFAGICWLPVVYLQIQMQKMAEQAVLTNTDLPMRYHRYARWWFWLGVPAFLAIILVIFMMVFHRVFWV